MSLRVRLTKDDITPDLRKKVAALGDARPVLRAVGTELVSITKRAFRDPALRQFAWAPKKGGQPSNLIDKGMLISSIRVAEVTGQSVTIGSDRRYAAIHQLGGKKRPMPARPFFPFTGDGKVAAFAVPRVAAVLEAALARILGT